MTTELIDMVTNEWLISTVLELQVYPGGGSSPENVNPC